MKKKLRLSFIHLFLVILPFSLYSQAIPEDSLYLCQTPPDGIPKIFLLPVTPGYVAAERIAISNDGKEIYYTEKNGYSPGSKSRLKYFTYSEKGWIGSFNLFDHYSKDDYITSPGLSPDSRILFFHDFQLQAYYSVKKDSGWSEPVIFWNNSLHKHYLQLTNSGNYYLSNPKGSTERLGICKIIINDSDTTFQSVGLPINPDKDPIDFFISRDESFIIYSSLPNPNRPCFGYADLFISYKKSDNTWTNPKNLGPIINSVSTGRWGPYTTADNRYLFFSSGNGPSDTRINWVRIDNVIDSLNYTNFIPYVKNPIPDQTAIKDSSFNYQIPDSTFIDDDGNNTLSYVATLSNGSSLPAWLSFSSATRIFSGAPTAATTISIKVTVTDTANASVSCTFNIGNVLTGVEEDKNKIPNNFHLGQNYPNPFNPTTIIQYSLSKPSQVKLIIYNLLGQKILTIIDTFQNAGDHSTVWNGMDERYNPVSSGVYFYSLETNDRSLQKKMVLLR